ncbi:MAG: transglycosylase SLT domain-containing protein [Pseudonocardia sp.]
MLLIALVVAVDSEQTPGGGVGGVLNATSAPAKFAPWLQKAGGLCPQIGAPLLAAQLAQESGFSTQAVSPSGAQGPAQFMPGTWPSWGRDETTYLVVYWSCLMSHLPGRERPPKRRCGITH